MRRDVPVFENNVEKMAYEADLVPYRSRILRITRILHVNSTITAQGCEFLTLKRYVMLVWLV